MKHTLLPVLGCVLTLAACNNSDHTIVAGNEPTDDFNSAAEGNVVLPPAIAATKSYRCSDGAVVYVDWLSDGKTANIRTEEAGTPTQVSAPEAGKEMTAAGGYSLSGTADASSAKIGIPGHPAQSCKG